MRPSSPNHLSKVWELKLQIALELMDKERVRFRASSTPSFGA
jgi:hypothetical protein